MKRVSACTTGSIVKPLGSDTGLMKHRCHTRSMVRAMMGAWHMSHPDHEHRSSGVDGCHESMATTKRPPMIM
eukprot:scaffold221845_cov29-Tisochrysis_lutea.AAC.1